MNGSNGDRHEGSQEDTNVTLSAKRTPKVEAKNKKSLSMHEGVAVWCDCCSCEAEPYWAELAQEMGIDLGSDYE